MYMNRDFCCSFVMHLVVSLVRRRHTHTHNFTKNIHNALLSDEKCWRSSGLDREHSTQRNCGGMLFFIKSNKRWHDRKTGSTVWRFGDLVTIFLTLIILAVVVVVSMTCLATRCLHICHTKIVFTCIFVPISK